MLSINPKEISPLKLQSYLQTAVSPRPIAFASTMDDDGNPNLSPFSFFNVFSSNPPILIFSPARRVRNNTIKHTLINAQDTREVVINIDQARIRPWEIWHLQSDNTKLYSVIESRSTTNLEDSLSKTIKYFYDNGSKWDWIN